MKKKNKRRWMKQRDTAAKPTAELFKKKNNLNLKPKNWLDSKKARLGEVNSASGKRQEDGTETTEFIKRRPHAEVNMAGISGAHLVEPKNAHLVSAEVPTT